MWFKAYVLLPSDTGDILAAVTRMMEPYELYRKVPPHKEIVPQDEIDYLVDVYGLDPKNLEAVMAELHEESGFACSIEGGTIYWMTTDNPQGRWDSWKLPSLEDSVWRLPSIPRDPAPFAIVTPDGVWHDLGDQWNMTEDENVKRRQRAEVVLAEYSTYLAVALDCHR